MSGTDNKNALTSAQTARQRDLFLAVVALGFTSIALQVIFLRECLAVFYGNELVIGVVLAGWMLLTGVGSVAGQSSSDKTDQTSWLLIILFALLGLLPIATVFGLRVLRGIFVPVGSMVSMTHIVLYTVGLLAPYCLIAGFLFTRLSHLISRDRETNSVPAVYSWEAVGSVVGGLVFNLVLIHLVKTLEALLILASMNAAVVLLLARRVAARRAQYVMGSAATAVLVFVAAMSLDDRSLGLLFRDQEVVYFKDTPFGNLTVTRQAEQVNFFEDNVLSFSTNDPVHDEESVHYAMVQHPNPKRVLCVAGSWRGMIEEIRKYDVDKIHYVEINEWLIDAARTFIGSIEGPKVEVFGEDPRLFIRHTGEQYDVALINVPEPNTIQVNRFYTSEFIREVKLKLTAGGVLGLSLASSADYMSDEARQVRSIIHSTLVASFATVLVIPGGKDFLLASDASLSTEVARRIEERAIKTSFVNRYYIDDALLGERSATVMHALAKDAPLNKDFAPVAVYHQQLLWLSQFEFSHWLPLAACGVVFVFVAVRPDAVGFAMLTGGFVASAVQIILLIAFQILYGNVFHHLGLLITAFMAGLAVGSAVGPRLHRGSTLRALVYVQLIIAVYCVVLPTVFGALVEASPMVGLIQGIFLVLSFLVAFLTGTQFALATGLRRGTPSQVAGGLYGAELTGSAVGAFLVATLLMPWLGVKYVCDAIAGLTIFSAVILVMQGNRSLSSAK